MKWPLVRQRSSGTSDCTFDALVNGSTATCKVDTGAAVTVISNKVLNDDGPLFLTVLLGRGRLIGNGRQIRTTNSR